MTIKIRKFEKQDLSQVLDLCRYIRNYHIDMMDGYFAPQNDEEEQKLFLDSLTNSDIFAGVADDDGKIIGLALAQIKNAPYLIGKKIINVDNIVVSDDNQKSGIGKLLMDAIYDFAKTNNVPEIKLSVFNGNIKALKFYEKYGFNLQEQRLSLTIK